MKSTIFKSTVLALIVSSPMSVIADESLPHAGGISNPIEAIVQIPVAGVRVATGVLALPLMFVGEIGNISGQAGEMLWEHASHLNDEPMQAADTNNPVNSNERFL